MSVFGCPQEDSNVDRDLHTRLYYNDLGGGVDQITPLSLKKSWKSEKHSHQIDLSHLYLKDKDKVRFSEYPEN